MCVCVCVCVYLSRGKTPRKLPREDLIPKLRPVWFPNLRYLFSFSLVGENIGLLIICAHPCLGFTNLKKEWPPNRKSWHSSTDAAPVGSLVHSQGIDFLPKGIFLTQGLNLGLLHCRQTLQFESPGKPPDRFRFVAQMVKNSPAVQETQVQSLEAPLEKAMGNHSSILRLPWWIWWLRIHLQCRRPRTDPWVGRFT